MDVAISKGPAALQLLAHKDETLLAKGTLAKAFKKNISATAHRTSPQSIVQATQKENNKDSEDAILVEGWGSIQCHNTHHWHKGQSIQNAPKSMAAQEQTIANGAKHSPSVSQAQKRAD